MLLEVCANSLESALIAQKAGADRIELCMELGVGGVTPSFGMLKNVREQVSIPIHVLIRPRSGDFTYSDSEFEIMRTNIEQCAVLGMDGIVSGVLYRDFTLDKQRTSKIRAWAKGMHFTFHRAFDWVLNPLDTLVELEAIGIDAILSSGQQDSALKGLDLLKQLSEMATDCTILPGGGVRVHNVHQFVDAGFDAIHLSGTHFRKTLDTMPRVSMNSSSFLKENEVATTHLETVAQIVALLKS